MANSVLKQVSRAVLLLLGLWLGLDLVSRFAVESLWFQEVGYSQAFWLRLTTRAVLLLIGLGVTGGFLGSNLVYAYRREYPQDYLKNSGERRRTSGFGLRWLLPIALLLALLAIAMLLHYVQVAVSYWGADGDLSVMSRTLPPSFWLDSCWQLLQEAIANRWQFFAVLGLSVTIVIAPKLLFAIAIAITLCFSVILSGNWAKVLQFFHPIPFNNTEPLFNHDIGFYVFTLPVWELLEFWLTGLFLYALVAVALIYLRSGNSLSEGRFPGFSVDQQRHLNGLGSGLSFAIALHYWLARYELLYSTRGVVYGASYTEATVERWVDTALAVASLAIAIFLLWRTLNKSKVKTKKVKVFDSIVTFAICLVTIYWVLQTAVQRLVVQPNELAREKPYIERNIAFTRQAFGLDKIEVKTFDPAGKLTYADLNKNALTIRNIRLWDKRPLLLTNRQLQQIRSYYKFPDADIDRYALKTDLRSRREKQQVIVAARELDYSAVPQEAKTWVNEHLVYTHGYGFTLSPVNTVDTGGLPDYFVKDIGVDTSGDSNSTLGTSGEWIRASIPIGYPRIYYGEIADTYVMAPTKVAELDYPSGDENVTNSYDGAGGVAIQNWWRRLVFSKYLNNSQLLLTRNFTPDTKLLFRRNIKERIRAIAPFLRYDSDPYLVVANASLRSTENLTIQKPKSNMQNREANNYLYWIVDAYTTSDRYPYSDPGNSDFNYIRNSVKVVIDAYNGFVEFYVTDPDDPIIKSWMAIFPKMLKPISTMPINLRSHIRYPVDLFKIQSERLLTYHMTDPQVFYNREDQWRVPNEIYGNQPQPVEPYYLIMKLPTAKEEEFIQLLPFTPASRNNLIGWLAARSDGSDYGKLLLYQFPKQRLVYGPEQIEARINQDPIISEQISLWNRQGSKAIQGNLLVIPINQSLLYVEPLYLEADYNSLPTLVRVSVAYENSIVMAETLQEALQAIFQPPQPRRPAIVRPLSLTPPAPPR